MKAFIAFLTTALAAGVLLDAVSPSLWADEIASQSGFQSGAAVPVVSALAVSPDQPVNQPIFPPGPRSAGQLPAGEFVAPTGAGQRSVQPSVQPWDNAPRRRRQWVISLAPLFASEALDAASSYGRREQNPLLAGADGSFGMRAAGIKFGVVGALAGGEYLVVRKHPAAAKFFTVVNWVTAGATTGLAIHNFRLH
jgi:hypothetical protein